VSAFSRNARVKKSYAPGRKGASPAKKGGSLVKKGGDLGLRI